MTVRRNDAYQGWACMIWPVPKHTIRGRRGIGETRKIKKRREADKDEGDGIPG